MTKKAKPKKTAKQALRFDGGQHLGHGLNMFIVADTDGKVWIFDTETGQARPVVFKATKLTPDVVRKIRRARGTQAAIAERFGLSQSHVYGILSGKRWSHV